MEFLKDWKTRFAEAQRWTPIVALVIIIFLGQAVIRGWDYIRAFEWQINLLHLGLAIISYLIGLGIMFLGWYSIMGRLVGLGNLTGHLKIYAVSFLARRIPLPIWFVGSRIILYKQLPKKTTATATLLETIFIGLAGLVLYILIAPFATAIPGLPWPVGALLVAAGVSSLIIKPSWPVDFSNKILTWLKKSTVDASITRLNVLTWMLAFGSSWLAGAISFYFLSMALIPTDPGFLNLMLVGHVSGMIGYLTLFLPAGFGLKELGMSSLLTRWMPFSVGVVLAIAYRLLGTLIETVWAFATNFLLKERGQ